MTLMSYFTFLCVSTFISFKITAKHKVKIIPELISVKLPRNYSTIVILILFFVVKYFFGYINAAQYDLYRELTIFEVSINGLFTGYFLGKAINYLSLYFENLYHFNNKN